MKIQTGLTIPIERDGAHVGDLHFNPDDVCFVERVYDLIGELQQAEKTYEARAQELEVDNSVDEYGIPQNIRARLNFCARPAKISIRRSIQCSAQAQVKWCSAGR